MKARDDDDAIRNFTVEETVWKSSEQCPARPPANDRILLWIRQNGGDHRID
jgi:hypothetical protein